ncbi:MAG TPA: hypothetical protein VE379_07285, partial [Vicinamibacterales bacterium]|nr:hypothetical protein [Vicinamibacterales bacterium]
ADGEVVYCVRVPARRFQPPVYALGTFTLRIGKDRPDGPSLNGLQAFAERRAAGRRVVRV